MSFTERQKTEARQKAGYKCAWCQKLGGSLEVHHILSQKNGGADELDNAVTLCPTCHADVGANPEKRSQLRERRDWIHACVAKMLGSPEELDLVGKIASMTDLVAADPGRAPELRNLVHTYVDHTFDHTQSGVSVAATASDIVNAAAGLPYKPTSTKLADRVHANVECSNCGTRIGLLIGQDTCPGCGLPLPGR